MSEKDIASKFQSADRNVKVLGARLNVLELMQKKGLHSRGVGGIPGVESEGM